MFNMQISWFSNNKDNKSEGVQKEIREDRMNIDDWRIFYIDLEYAN